MDIEFDEITDSSSFIPDERRQINAKWGNAVSGGGLTGFLALPEVLIRGQHLLGRKNQNGKNEGLSSTEMMVLINVLMHWWFADRKPFPGNHVIAKRMGVSTRTVQRAFMELDRKGVIKRVIRRYHDKNTNARHSVREVDLTALVTRLEEIAVELKTYNRKQASKDKDRVFRHVV